MVDSLLLIGSLILFVGVYKAFDWLRRHFYIGRLGDRYILVTGCDTGFGNATAKRLDALGCHVFAGCLTEAGETELSKSCSSRMQPVSLDVSKPDSVRRAFDIVKGKLPAGKGLWGVVNNAGIMGAFGPPEWITVDDYKYVAAVNLYGLIDVTMTFLPLVKMARGRVVNTSSSAGRFSVPFFAPYCVAKYGVEAFTDGLRRSLYPFGVKAMLVEPGGHATNLTARSNLETAASRAWNNAPPEAKEEYGQAYFNALTTVFLDSVFTKPPGNLADVVEAYVHALFGRYPRARYLVGIDARAVILLQALPEWVSDWAVCKMMPIVAPQAVIKTER